MESTKRMSDDADENLNTIRILRKINEIFDDY